MSLKWNIGPVYKRYRTNRLVVVLFAYPIKLNISTRKAECLDKEGSYKNSTVRGSCIVILTDLSKGINTMLDKISFHNDIKSYSEHTSRLIAIVRI